MFLGEYRHTIDTKRRLAIPVKFRDELGLKAILARGLDNCLFVYPQKAWDDLAQKLNALPTGQSSTRSFVRLMLAGAFEGEPDRLGRILIPDQLCQFAGFKKRVVVAGVFSRLEIWDEQRWDEYRKKAEASGDEIAEKLGELGVY